MQHLFYAFPVQHPESVRAGRFLFRFKYAEGQNGWWSLYLEKNTVPAKRVTIYEAPTKQILSHRIYQEQFPVEVGSELQRACDWLEKRHIVKRINRPKAWR